MSSNLFVPPRKDFEQIHQRRDPETGFTVITAIDERHFNPFAQDYISSGGIRFQPYPTFQDAENDALRLSRGMTDKFLAADEMCGGGKTVIMGDPSIKKTDPGAWIDFARFFADHMNSMGGAYYGGEDVGININDANRFKANTPYILGTSSEKIGSGDPSRITAQGVFVSMEIALYALGPCAKDISPVDGATVAIQGLGAVGYKLAQLVCSAGGKLVLADINPDRVKAVRENICGEDCKVVSPQFIHKERVDIFAPCALGNVVKKETRDELNCRAVVGSANNQLGSKDDGDYLWKNRDILYVTDFLANSGGASNIMQELQAMYTDTCYSEERAMERATNNIKTAVNEFTRRLIETNNSPSEILEDMLSKRRKERSIF